MPYRLGKEIVVQQPPTQCRGTKAGTPTIGIIFGVLDARLPYEYAIGNRQHIGAN